MRHRWGSRLAETYNQPLKALPQIIRFVPNEMKITVRNNGRIALTNLNGDEVVLERITRSYAKKF